ncbi:type VI secretion system baseplate subunit TssE [Paraburkholderia sp. Tr-20389]|uniref:type VI secretion system baseplate subunit TssE n=1 Tax=Paraburkholderia sp. Tr-20389 TaxID=2703903 RepID=UPI00197F3DA2|nr:type VI secretion system baseplate subunit TssE [Paraburkholderia sp. Tr-20389]MBN3752375.1 type VI secretion system baseplate subunit TssE [Paraburkholderia sp. Tr-20389]
MPTLIDRLRDDAPHRQTEIPAEYAVTRARMREIIQRDIAYLLNTTNLTDQIDSKRHALAAGSTVNFGVPPLAGAFTAAYRWSDIEAAVQSALARFEPRLIPESIQLVPLSDADRKGRHSRMAFEIRGLVRIEPYPLEFIVQSSLDLETSRVQFDLDRA